MIDVNDPRYVHVYDTIGRTLQAIQIAEKFFLAVLNFTGSTVTWESVAAENVANRKSPMGRVLERLRKRAEIKPEFEEFLVNFIELRNEFVHNLIGNFEVPKDRRKIVKFCRTMHEEAEALTFTCEAILRTWGAPLIVGRIFTPSNPVVARLMAEVPAQIQQKKAPQ